MVMMHSSSYSLTERVLVLVHYFHFSLNCFSDPNIIVLAIIFIINLVSYSLKRVFIVTVNTATST